MPLWMDQKAQQWLGLPIVGHWAEIGILTVAHRCGLVFRGEKNSICNTMQPLKKHYNIQLKANFHTEFKI